MIFRSIYCIIEESHVTILSDKFQNTIEISGLPMHTLKLKNVVLVILLWNNEVSNTHYSGSRYSIKCCFKYSLKLRIYKSTTKFDSEDSNVQNQIFPVWSEDPNFQYNLLMWWHKVQKCGLILLENSVFTHGRLYVGLSQYADPRNIFIFALQDEFKCLKLQNANQNNR